MKIQGTSQIVQMNNAAREAMEAHGIDPAEINPDVVMLAMYPVEEVREAATEAILGPARLPVDIYKGEASEEDAEERTLVAEVGHSALATADRIARPARRRDVLLASFVGLVFGATTLIGAAKVKEDIQTDPASGVRPASNGDRVLSGTSLVGDSSILPGNNPSRIPLVGPILGKIPGVPDFGSVYVRLPTTVTRTTTGERIVLTDEYQAAKVVNPVSPDLQPTGKEYGLARRTANRLLKKLMPDHFNIDEVTVTGEVSDEFGGTLGEPNPEQQDLALTRAEITAQALEDEAREREIELPADIKVKGQEAVLSPRQIKRVNKAAGKMEISTSELLSLYNQGEMPNGRTKRLLDRYLGDNRGGIISIEGVRKQIKEYTINKKVEVNKDKLFPTNIPGEIFVGFGLFIGLMYGSLIATGRSHNRYIAKRSKAIAENKGLSL